MHIMPQEPCAVGPKALVLGLSHWEDALADLSRFPRRQATRLTAGGLADRSVRRAYRPCVRPAPDSPVGGGRMKVLALYTIKGGVGTTATAVDLAYGSDG